MLLIPQPIEHHSILRILNISLLLLLLSRFSHVQLCATT